MRPPAFIVLDLETTGLDATKDRILEIGIGLYDEQFEAISEWQSLVWPGVFNFDSVDEFVKEMHDKSGLWLDLKATSHLQSPQFVEYQALSWLESFGISANSFPMTGSSVHFDRSFLKAQMPALDAFFTHRIIDVSSFKMLARKLKLDPEYRPDNAAHRAIDDVRASMEELAFYVRNHFKQAPLTP